MVVATTDRILNSNNQPEESRLFSDDEDILKDICLVNGLSYNRITRDGVAVKGLEFFFSGYHKLIDLFMFPNLSRLVINGQNIYKMEGLESLVHLQELWICECKIRVIEGLDCCIGLEKLYLYGNCIKKIENLSTLTALRVLSLSNNLISLIEEISLLPQLVELNLAGNFIEKIGHSLDQNLYLEVVNLSGNKIYTLTEITALSRLPRLKILGLRDPEYPVNPVCSLCNYTTHILYHLPGLTYLDSISVKDKTLFETVETTVQKKKLYYRVQSKSIERRLEELLKLVRNHKRSVKNLVGERLRKLWRSMKEIDRELYITEKRISCANPDTVLDADEQYAVDLRFKRHAVESHADKLENQEELEFYYKQTCSRLRESAEFALNQMDIELTTGGNVRFELGRPEDNWYSSCKELFLSRFSVDEFRGTGCTGVTLRKLYRVHNRVLRMKFDQGLTDLADNTDCYLPISRNSTYKKYIDYLFWVANPNLPDWNDPLKLCQEGLHSPELCSDIGVACAIATTNSLYHAEEQRIRYVSNLSLQYHDPCPYRHGYVLLCKVYLGRCAKLDPEKEICKNNYIKADSVYSQLNPTESSSPMDDKCQRDCSKRFLWYCFDNRLVLPEYLVEFTYQTKSKMPSPFAALDDGRLDFSEDLPQPSFWLSEDEDQKILDMDPTVKPRPKISVMNDELLRYTAAPLTLGQLSELNLHGNGLARIPGLHSLTALTKLVLSFNDIQTMDVLACLDVQFLDVSFNKLSTMDGLRGMHKLRHLDISWNALSQWNQDLDFIKRHAPSLTSLDLRYNPWIKIDDEELALHTVGKLRGLLEFNTAAVSEELSARALRVAASSRVTEVSLLTHGRADPQKPRTLHLGSAASHLLHLSRNKITSGLTEATVFSAYLNLTSLCLNSQHLTKLSNLELPNLRWASFCHNCIPRIEGLTKCIFLEELWLDDNMITDIAAVSELSNLKVLSLVDNMIIDIPTNCFQDLTVLRYLALDRNRIWQLLPIRQLHALIEFYCSSNMIDNIREIFHLKGLAELVVLDLHGNPVVSSAVNYRLYVVYYLRSLKSFDGSPVDSSEGSLARDTFGGKLTPDFVAERLGHADFQVLRELDVANCRLSSVDLNIRGTSMFSNLRSLNLEDNNFTSFSGLIHLRNLRVLCLNNNRVDCIVPKHFPSRISGGRRNFEGAEDEASLISKEMQPVLENLEVLHLAFNGIREMAQLQLGRLTALKALFLQGNEIYKIEGLEGLTQLRELVLDRNRIKNIYESSFVDQGNLSELHIEENRLRDLNYFHTVPSLQRLYLGSNKISDIGELEKLDGLTHLVEISLLNNAVTKRQLHRPYLVYKFPSLMLVDGLPVSEEERVKAEMYFMEQHIPPDPPVAVLPNITSTVNYQRPVRITNMQLGAAAGTSNFLEKSMKRISPHGDASQRSRVNILQPNSSQSNSTKLNLTEDNYYAATSSFRRK